MTTSSEQFDPVEALFFLTDRTPFLGVPDVQTASLTFTAKNSRRAELYIDAAGKVTVLDYVVQKSFTLEELKALETTDQTDRVTCARILARNGAVEVFDYERLVPAALQTALQRATARAKLDEVDLSLRMATGERVHCTFGGNDLYAQFAYGNDGHILSKEEEETFLDKHGARYVLRFFLIACWHVATKVARWNKMQATPEDPF